MKALKLITAATEDPVDLTGAKAHLRVSTSGEDALISALIAAATKVCEDLTGRAFVSQPWDLWMDRFPSSSKGSDDWWDGTREGYIPSILGCPGQIELPIAPLVSVTSITTYDLADAATVFSSSGYFVDTMSEPPRIALKSGYSWPTSLRGINAIAIRCVFGYGTSDDVPQAIKQAILMLISHWFENRETVVVGTITKDIEFGVAAILGPYMIRKL